MALDAFLVSFAFSAGAVSFFSPCSVGLFPAYVGYYLAGGRNPAEGGTRELAGANPAIDTIWRRLADGIWLGGLAAAGFFALFLAVGFVVSQVGSQLLGPYLRGISIGIGITIVALGLLTALGAIPAFHLPVRAPRSRTPLSIMLFGVGYGLASLGCTLPIFLSTLLASLAAAGASGALLVLLAYASGMGLVMVAATISLSVSEEAARKYVRKVVPYVEGAGAILMAVAGGVVIYFYAVIWR